MKKKLDSKEKDRLNKVISSPILKKQKEILEYWSTVRMKNAIPIESINKQEKPNYDKDHEPWEQEGTPTIIESKYPKDTDEINLPKIKKIKKSRGFSTNLISFFDYYESPYKPVGKLFMSFGNKDYVGTAWVIAHEGICTAGHCVYNHSEGGWANNVMFIPGHSDNNDFNPVCIGVELNTLKGWKEKRDFSFDIATIKLSENIGNWTGSIGVMFNFPPNQGKYNSIGYPAKPKPKYPFFGVKMWHSIGNYISGTREIKMQNNMTGGSSGGPWVITRNNMHYANGINSFTYKNEPNNMYSPYFGQGILNLYNEVKNV
jgi:V8-like Glu-specific endopeptidase